jgi:hypothetical protein
VSFSRALDAALAFDHWLHKLSSTHQQQQQQPGALPYCTRGCALVPAVLQRWLHLESCVLQSACKAVLVESSPPKETMAHLATLLQVHTERFAFVGLKHHRVAVRTLFAVVERHVLSTLQKRHEELAAQLETVKHHDAAVWAQLCASHELLGYWNLIAADQIALLSLSGDSDAPELASTHIAQLASNFVDIAHRYLLRRGGALVHGYLESLAQLRAAADPVDPSPAIARLVEWLLALSAVSQPYSLSGPLRALIPRWIVQSLVDEVGLPLSVSASGARTYTTDVLFLCAALSSSTLDQPSHAKLQDACVLVRHHNKSSLLEMLVDEQSSAGVLEMLHVTSLSREEALRILKACV